MRNLILTTIAVALAAGPALAGAAGPAFGPENPFYAPSKLPFQAPPFDKIPSTT